MGVVEQVHVAESSSHQQQEMRQDFDSIDRQQPKRSRVEVDAAEQVHMAESSRLSQQRTRQALGSIDQQQARRRRTVIRRERCDEEQLGDIVSVLRALDEEFAEKERLSAGGEWCTPIPQARKVSTVQEFYKAFHDVRTLPIRTCML